MTLPAPTERFAALVARPDESVDLDVGALCIAAHAHAGLDIEAQLRRLDDLALGVPEPTLDGLLAHLFRSEGFRPAVQRYGDPDSSFLDAVLDRREGIPISLSILVLEVGRRVGVPLAGVSMPGHFLLRDRVDPTVFVDPFGHGSVLDAAGCRAIFERLHPDQPFRPQYLDPVGPKAILARVLTNLSVAYRRSGDRRSLTWVLDLRCRLPGATPSLRRELAVLLSAGGRYLDAARQLERIGNEEADTAARRLRARLN